MKTQPLGRLAVLAVAALLIISASSPAAAVDGVKISGTVYYSTTPLAGVAVTLQRDSSSGALFASTASGGAGAYQFVGVPAGMFYIKVYGPSAEYCSWTGSTILVAESDIVRDLHVVKALTALSPARGSLVSAASPRFCWLGLPEAAQYELQLSRRSDGSLIEDTLGITGTCYTTAHVLEPRVEYSWFVAASDDPGNLVGISPNLFFTYLPLGWRWYLPLALR